MKNRIKAYLLTTTAPFGEPFDSDKLNHPHRFSLCLGGGVWLFRSFTRHSQLVQSILPLSEAVIVKFKGA